MTPAYAETYLGAAQRTLGASFDYAVNGLGVDLRSYYALFLASPLSLLFAAGVPQVVAGMSGAEVALAVLGKSKAPKRWKGASTSPEYWTGWALAYYEWACSLSFQEIDAIIPVSEVRSLYHPYHEMDLRQFAGRMDELYAARFPETNLARLRKNIGLSQEDLANLSLVSKRTIQQYEQRQKDINKAAALTVLALAKALNCDMGALLEKRPVSKEN